MTSLQAMAPRGTELAFGYLRDPDFGPLVMVGAGGTLIELLGDRVTALAPFGPRRARSLIDRLQLRPMLDGRRGGAAADIDALALALARFSVLCENLAPAMTEMDVNPVIAGPQGCLAVEARSPGPLPFSLPARLPTRPPTTVCFEGGRVGRRAGNERRQSLDRLAFQHHADGIAVEPWPDHLRVDGERVIEGL
jgi:hypothetical protein